MGEGWLCEADWHIRCTLSSDEEGFSAPRTQLAGTEADGALTEHYWNVYKRFAQKSGTYYIGRVREMLEGYTLVRAERAVGSEALDTPVYMTDRLRNDSSDRLRHMAAVEGWQNTSAIWVNSFVYADPANVVFGFGHELIHIRQTQLGRAYNPGNVPYAQIPQEFTANKGAEYIAGFPRQPYMTADTSPDPEFPNLPPMASYLRP